MNDNKINKIDFDGFKGLNKLKMLFLAKNQLKLIDLQILIDLTGLTDLYMEDNRITNIIGLKFPLNLKILNLSNNKLKTLDHSMLDDLDHIEILFLNDNRFNKETETRLKNQLKNIEKIIFYS